MHFNTAALPAAVFLTDCLNRLFKLSQFRYVLVIYVFVIYVFVIHVFVIYVFVIYVYVIARVKDRLVHDGSGFALYLG